MRWIYLFKHWGLTILLGSLFSVFYYMVTDFQSFEDISILFSKSIFELLFLFLILSFLYSTPTYLAYTILFAFLENKSQHILLNKILLLSLAQIGIWISFYWISEGWFADFLPFTLSYAIASLGSGVLLKLSKK